MQDLRDRYGPLKYLWVAFDRTSVAFRIPIAEIEAKGFVLPQELDVNKDPARLLHKWANSFTWSDVEDIAESIEVPLPNFDAEWPDAYKWYEHEESGG